jgi:PAS domain S-box-containing protein
MKSIVLDPVQRRRQLIYDVLTRRKHDVTLVGSVSDLIAGRQSQGHQLVFIAAEVVRREGLPLSQQLRLPGKGGSCVLLALEDADGGDPQDLLVAGVDDVLAEPFDADTVVLRTSIAEHRLRRGRRRERWFETLIALGTTVYMVTDAQGIVLYTSPSLTTVSGFLPGYMIGKSVFDLVLPEDCEEARAVFSEVVSQPGHAARAQLSCWNRDGSWNIVDTSVRNSLEDPLIGGVIITLTDVTKQRETESALQESETRYRTLVETAREGIGICDADENLTFVNPAFGELLGYERHELEGMNLRDLTDELEFERLKQATAQRRLGIASRYEARFFTKQRELRILSLSATPLLDDAGDFVGSLALATDITNQRRAAEKLRKSEERYRLIAENVSDVIWTQHLPEPVVLSSLPDRAAAEAFALQLLDALAATYVSPSVTRMLGYTVTEALSLAVRDILTPSSFAHVQQFIAASLQAGGAGNAATQGPVTLELEYVRKDQQTCWGEITGNLLRDDNGRVIGTLAVTRDVTERKHVETALQESEFHLRRLIENMPDFVILVDENADIRYVNRGVAGFGPDQLVGQRGFGFLEKEYHPACQAAFAAALATGEVQFVEALDIFGLWWSCRLVPLSEKKLSAHVMIICTDVTEEKRANETVRKEQDLLRQLIELHERDRKLLAFELHDGFAQQLTGAMMSLEAATRLATTNPEKADGPLREATRLLSESIDESRRLVSGLRPPVLDQFGIVPAVEHLVGLNHRDEQLNIEFVSRGRVRRLAAPLENAIFRIVQETLANIRRHSDSRKAVVELELHDEHVDVVVRDWGIGFESEGIREACFGLRGIRERARLLGGCAEIESARGEGTTVRVSLPMIELRPEDDDREDDATEPGITW